MQLSAFDHLLWATGFVEDIVLLCVLIFLRRAKTFPIFTALIGYGLLESAVLFVVYSHASGRTAYWTYWLMGAVDMMLETALVYEIASHVFAPLGQWAEDVRRSFVGLVGGSILVALLLSALFSPVEHRFAERVISRGNLFSGILLVELFAGLVVLSAIAGLPWRTHVARIAQGAGALAVVSVLFDTYHSWLKWGPDAATIQTLNHIRGVASLATFAFWIVTLWQDAPEQSEMPEAMRVQFFQLHRQLEYDLGRIRGWRKV